MPNSRMATAGISRRGGRGRGGADGFVGRGPAVTLVAGRSPWGTSFEVARWMWEGYAR